MQKLCKTKPLAKPRTKLRNDLEPGLRLDKTTSKPRNKAGAQWVKLGQNQNKNKSLLWTFY